MGEVVKTADMKRVIDSNVQAYVTQVTGSYARLFGRSPTFVTYYSQDLASSGADVNLGGVIEILGPESPIRFKAVHDFPIYGISAADVSQAYDETQGVIAANIGGEAHILPGTLEPNENDLFVIQHLQTKLVFRVKVADADRIEGKSYFKLQYFMDYTSPESLRDQTVGSYTFELANVGTEHTPLVEMDTALMLRELDLLVENMRQAYWRAFYDRSSGTLLLRDSNRPAIHDRAVDHLVSRYDLLSSTGYLGSRTVRPAVYDDRGYFEDFVYPVTIYAQLEKGSWDRALETTNRAMLADVRPNSAASPFFADFAVDGYLETTMIPLRSDVQGAITYGGTDLIAKTALKDFTDNSPIRVLVRRILAGSYAVVDRATLRSFIDALPTLAGVGRTESFWLTPIVLFEAARLSGTARRTTD